MRRNRSRREWSFLKAEVIGMLLSVAAASGAERRLILPIVEGADIVFSSVSFGAGVSRANVAKIVQGDQGFLWFGTLQGLRRYDGYDFRPFRPDPDNPESLRGNFVVSLFKDHSGSLWIGSDAFLDRYDARREAFVHYDGTADSDLLKGPVYRISEDREGILWLCTDQGLDRLEPATGRITRYSRLPGSTDALMSNLVRAALEDRSGDFWVASAGGVDLFDRKRGKAIRHFPFDFHPGSGPISLFEDRAGVLWLTFAAGNGLASIDRTTGKYTQYETGERKTTSDQLSGVACIDEDADGALWLGTFGGGILRLNRERTRFMRYRHNAADLSSLSNDTVNDLFEDREGTMWVGTANGINRFARKRPRFQIYRHVAGHPGSLAGDDVHSIFEDSRRTLWVGARGVLNEVTRNGSSYSSHSFPGPQSGGISNPTVLSMAEDLSGNLWFGTLGGGLNRFDPRKRRINVFRHDPTRNDSLSHEYPSSLHVDRKGTLWVGTDTSLDRFDSKRLNFAHFRPDLQALVRYHAIQEDRHGDLWLASWGAGLHRFDPATGKFAVYTHKSGDSNSLSNDRVNSICIDLDGILWVGTTSGLDRFDPKTEKFRTFYERDGLSDNTVFAILEDGRGDLWLRTGSGLSHFDPKRNVFRNYDASDGLPTDDFSGFPAASQTASGEMFFGFSNGAISFFPDEIVDDSTPPPVVLTDFRLFGTPVSVGGDSVLKESISVASSLTLPPQQNTFSLEFAALSFRSPERNRYRIQLENFEKRWNEISSNRRFTTYTAVAPGEYLFRVQASDDRGTWNETGASVRIRILPPWWSTWWFRGSFLATLLASLWAAYQYRLYQIAREYNAQLEGRVDERLRVARDLHDTLLQSFHGLLMRFQAAHNLLPGRAPEARDMLETALDDAARAITQARDAVQDLRSSSVITNDLAQAVEAVGDELAAEQSAATAGKASFSVEVEGAVQDLHPILRDEIYGIAREALRNAFHHARARRIEVEIRYEARQLRVRVRDDGIGIDPSYLGPGRTAWALGDDGYARACEACGRTTGSME